MINILIFNFLIIVNIEQINISETWGIVAAVFIVIMPLACEVYDILKSKRQQRRVDDENEAMGYLLIIMKYYVNY